MRRALTIVLLASSIAISATAGADDPDRVTRDEVARADEAFRSARFAEARASYAALLAKRSGPSRTLHEQIARCLSQEGDHAAALAHLVVVLAAEPTNDGLRIWMAQENLKAGRVAEARALLAAARFDAIRDPGVPFDIAALLINRFQAEEALPYFTRAIALDPRFVEAWFRRGLACLQLRRWDEAKRDLRKVVELAPDSETGRTAREALETLR